MKLKLIIIYALTGVLGLGVQAQNSIKLNKQQTTFFYTQVNLHGGYMEHGKVGSWDFADRSPSNQVAFSLLKKNQRQLQKGYIRFASPVSYFLQVSTPFKGSMNGAPGYSNEVQLKLLAAWVKFNTKWDRSYFWIGYKSIPYGHNPKIDPVSSFLPNPTNTDVGFAQDLGVFFRSTLNRELDYELSLTSGGMLNQSMLNYQFDPEASQAGLNNTNYTYQNTWLVTGRVGNQSFKKNELGVIGAIGRVDSRDYAGDFANIHRIGAEWIYKYYEKMKFSSIASYALVNNEQNSDYNSYNLQSNAEFFILRNFSISTSIGLMQKDFIGNEDRELKIANANSLTYNVSPHTRIRLNHYLDQNASSGEKDWGLLLQLVTGFGKRN